MKLLMSHRWLRRITLVPAAMLLFIWLLGLLPVWLIGAAFASRFVPGHWRVLRLFWFFVLYMGLQVVGLLGLLLLWVLEGFGIRTRSEASLDRHYRLMGLYLHALVGTARRTFGLRFVNDGIDGDAGSAAALDSASTNDRPVLVFSRHAGPGDSLLLVDAVCNRAHRRPRIVLKDFLQIDPAIDVLLNRVPSRFVPTFGRSRHGMVDAIAELAGSCGNRDALILFPEGGNFTEERHGRAVEQLESIGRPELAERARELQHLLPPKPAGALAAIDAAESADIVFVGHVGLERLDSMRDLWRGMPMDNVVRVRRWVVTREEIPEPSERELWLYDQWEKIDQWIADWH